MDRNGCVKFDTWHVADNGAQVGSNIWPHGANSCSVQTISEIFTVTCCLKSCKLAVVAVANRPRRWRSRIVRSSQRDVTRGSPDFWRMATDPFCWTCVLRLWIVWLFHPQTRANLCYRQSRFQSAQWTHSIAVTQSRQEKQRRLK